MAFKPGVARFHRSTPGWMPAILSGWLPSRTGLGQRAGGGPSHEWLGDYQPSVLPPPAVLGFPLMRAACPLMRVACPLAIRSSRMMRAA